MKLSELVDRRGRYEVSPEELALRTEQETARHKRWDHAATLWHQAMREAVAEAVWYDQQIVTTLQPDGTVTLRLVDKDGAT